MSNSKFYFTVDELTQASASEIFENEEGAKDYYNKSNASDNSFEEARRIEGLAKVWAKGKFADWNASLAPEEKLALVKYTNFANLQNNYLRKFRALVEEKGDLPQKDWEEYQKYNANVKQLDQALEKSRITQPMYVYRRVEEIHFFPKEPNVKMKEFSESGKSRFNEDVITRIQREFIDPQKEYCDPSHVSTSLSQDPVGALGMFGQRPILLRIKLPEGTNAAHLGEDLSPNFAGQNEVLIGRNNVFRYNKASMQNIHGNKVLFVDMEVVPSNDKNKVHSSQQETRPLDSNHVLKKSNQQSSSGQKQQVKQQAKPNKGQTLIEKKDNLVLETEKANRTLKEISKINSLKEQIARIKSELLSNKQNQPVNQQKTKSVQKVNER